MTRKDFTMNKNGITVNMENRALTVSKAFYKRASVYGSTEYEQLKRAMDENQGFKVEIKSGERKTYIALTFKRMAEYIKTQPNSENRMREFEAVKKIAEAKGSKYPLTKKWFLFTYPEYKKNEVSEIEAASMIAEAAEKPALAESDAA